MIESRINSKFQSGEPRIGLQGEILVIVFAKKFFLKFILK